MEFNLQTYLSEMREEINGKIDGVDGKLDKMVDQVNDHETRIVVVENMRRTIKWLSATVIGAGIIGAFDYVFTHLGGKHVP